MAGSFGLLGVGTYCLWMYLTHKRLNAEYIHDTGHGFGWVAVICFIAAPTSAFIAGAMGI